MRARLSPEERFLRHLGPPGPGGCREWLASKDRDGYGNFSWRDGAERGTRANRAAYRLFVGPIPPGLDVLHTCDNRACGEPSHLFVGDQQTNMADRDAKQRQARGERHGRARLSEIEVIAIRMAYAAGHRQIDLARHFGVSKSTVADILHSRSWTWLTVAA